MVGKSTLRFFWFAGGIMALRCRIAMTSLEYKFEDKIFGHQRQTKDPQNIHDDIGFILQSIKKQRPTYENNIFHVVEEKYPYSIKLLEDFRHFQP